MNNDNPFDKLYLEKLNHLRYPPEQHHQLDDQLDNQYSENYHSENYHPRNYHPEQPFQLDEYPEKYRSRRRFHRKMKEMHVKVSKNDAIFADLLFLEQTNLKTKNILVFNKIFDKIVQNHNISSNITYDSFLSSHPETCTTFNLAMTAMYSKSNKCAVQNYPIGLISNVYLVMNLLKEEITNSYFESFRNIIIDTYFLKLKYYLRKLYKKKNSDKDELDDKKIDEYIFEHFQEIYRSEHYYSYSCYVAENSNIDANHKKSFDHFACFNYQNMNYNHQNMNYNHQSVNYNHQNMNYNHQPVNYNHMNTYYNRFEDCG